MDTSPGTQAARKHLEDGIAQQKLGAIEPARKAYLRAIKSDPGCDIAFHNLGVIHVQLGLLDMAMAYFAQALQLDENKELFWKSYVRASIKNGAWHKAIAAYSDAKKMLPNSDISIRIAEMLCSSTGEGAHINLASELIRALLAHSANMDCVVAVGESLCARKVPRLAEELFSAWLREYPKSMPVELALGRTLEMQGRFAEASEIYRGLVRKNPASAEAHQHLGVALFESGAIADGFEHLMQRARIVSNTNHSPNPPQPAHRIKHDIEQREYLRALGIHTGSWDDIFHLGDGSRVEGRALNPVNDSQDVLLEWSRRQIPLLVIDQFLSPDALFRLQRYFAESTIWRRNYDAGYIGAVPHDGLACPLMAQIIEELISRWPGCFGVHALSYVGAFKYDSLLSTGTNTHADFAAINVNFYIAPDEANEDPQSGGMKVWNLSLDAERDLRRYNADEPLLNQLLERQKVEVVRIPHRCNRAVIFKSSLVHKTDECHFREGYLNKRINVSMLFGKLGSPLGCNIDGGVTT